MWGDKESASIWICEFVIKSVKFDQSQEDICCMYYFHGYILVAKILSHAESKEFNYKNRFAIEKKILYSMNNNIFNPF